MDAFGLLDTVTGDYATYAQSFLRIRDPDIARYVTNKLSEGALWPPPLVQLAPSYQESGAVDELVAAGLLHPLCGKIFRDPQRGGAIRLFRQQEQAIEAALRREHYILITGTGSGKSLTNLIPTVDHVLKHNPDDAKVRAIIVYPMNALIKSQFAAVQRFAGCWKRG
jgi:ATP-dependent helicase YprA (DUF1998 family)